MGISISELMLSPQNLHRTAEIAKSFKVSTTANHKKYGCCYCKICFLSFFATRRLIGRYSCHMG